MNNLVVCVNNSNKNVNIYETIDAIKEAGFENVFIQWYNENWNPTQEEQLKYIKKQGLNIIFAHLGYQNINDIWLLNEDESLVERYKNDIKICKDNGIDLVVMHLTRKMEAPLYNEIGLKRIKEIIEYAKSLNVKIAFENTKIKGYLDYIFDNINSDNIGLCYDSGHCHAHFKDEFNFEKYKNKIFAIHLHDNDGASDQHLLPFDGTINWNKVIDNLKKCNYNGPVTLELCYREPYLNISIQEFYKKGYKLGLEIEKMMRRDV